MNASTVTHRRGMLALTLQEALTTAIRLRSNRQLAGDALSFRNQIKQLLSAADQEARRAGYPGPLVKGAMYAYIAFLDESILNISQPVFAEWPRKPLQEEVFGHHTAGEIFFENIETLLAEPDSDDLADLLEVYQLCLLMGFEGRYRLAEKGELHRIVSTVSERITRIRGGQPRFSSSWAAPRDEALPARRDKWIRPLLLIGGGTTVSVFLLYLIFSLLLGSGVSELQRLATQIVP